MRHFPVFLNVQNRPVLVTGAGETAIAKLRLLLKTEGEVTVFARNPDPVVVSWEAAGLLTIHRREILAADFENAVMVYAAEDNEESDARTARLARNHGVLFNIVDNLAASEFITPAMVDRDPVTIAIGTEGTAPVLARKIKSEIEESLPGELGLLARLAERFRANAARIPDGRSRRRFWSRFFFEKGPAALKKDGEAGVRNTLGELLEDTLTEKPETGRVFLTGAGPGDPDLLTIKARKVLHEADVVVHDRLVSGQVLELARREAIVIETGKKGFGDAWKQKDINALMIEHAAAGSVVVRLKSGDPAVFARLDEEMDALDEAGIDWEIIPGITTASAAAANLRVSLTKRNRNSGMQFITGHDISGYAEQDWRALAKPGSVAAIYMGLKSARFLSGRLLMFGAAPDTPVTIVENVSRPDQRMKASSLASLVTDVQELEAAGPAILLLGLEPRAARQGLPVSQITEIINSGTA